MAVVRGLPDRHVRSPGRLGEGRLDAEARHRPRRDAGRGHRPHQGRHRLLAQQPHRAGGTRAPSCGASSTGSRRASWSCSTRPTVEFVTDPEPPDAIQLWREYPNLVVLRTFSKAYGLAGLRVGYAVAHDRIATALRQTAVPFGVNSIAQAAAVASLRAVAELEAARRRPGRGARPGGRPRWRTRAGKLPASEANFLWFPLGRGPPTSPPPAHEAGLMVRQYGDDGVRVTIGETEANDRLLEVARSSAPADATCAQVLTRCAQGDSLRATSRTCARGQASVGGQHRGRAPRGDAAAAGRRSLSRSPAPSRGPLSDMVFADLLGETCRPGVTQRKGPPSAVLDEAVELDRNAVLDQEVDDGHERTVDDPHLWPDGEAHHLEGVP